MRSRIPEFKELYISPHHLHDRWEELWAKLRATARRRGHWGLLDSVCERTILITVDNENISDEHKSSAPSMEVNGDNIQITLQHGRIMADSTGVVIDPEDGYKMLEALLQIPFPKMEPTFTPVADL